MGIELVIHRAYAGGADRHLDSGVSVITLVQVSASPESPENFPFTYEIIICRTLNSASCRVSGIDIPGAEGGPAVALLGVIVAVLRSSKKSPFQTTIETALEGKRSVEPPYIAIRALLSGTCCVLDQRD